MLKADKLAALSLITFAVAGVGWFALELTPPRLGYRDTDDPALMLRFVMAHPEVFVYSGLVMLLMAVSLTAGAVALADAVAFGSTSMALRIVTAFGFFAAALLFVSAGFHVGASGPLRHIAGLRTEWGEAAYLSFQVGSQAVTIVGLFTLSLWVVGHSLIGLRSGAIPVALAALGLLQTVRIALNILGPLDLAPEVLWIAGIALIPAMFLWCLVLGVVLWRHDGRTVDRGRPALAVDAGRATFS